MAQSINIKLADRTYPLKVNSPEHEEVIRKAADDINRMVAKYQEKFPGKGLVEILSFVALNTCMSNITITHLRCKRRPCGSLLGKAA